MKKHLLIILTACLIALFPLSGCSKESSKDTSNDSSKDNFSQIPVSEALEKVLALSDDELVYKYAENIEVCLGDDLLFTNPEDISSEALLTFFCYITSTDEFRQNHQQKWYDQEKNEYHIPVKDITDILSKYFDKIDFNPEEVLKYLYDPDKEEFIISTLSWFGGGSFPKLTNKEIVSNDTLKLRVDYYDPDYETVLYTKNYTLKFTDDGYKYLSITKE